MHAPDQNILHWTSITTVHTAIKFKLAYASSWILLLDYRSKPWKVRTKLAGTCSDFEEKVSEMVKWWNAYNLFHLILGCSIRHLAVPFDIWLFHLTFGCSIRHLAVPIDIWLFHSTFGCSIRHLAVPFNIWLFHSTFGCSIRHLAVPLDISFWLFHSTFGCSIRHLTVPFDIWLFHSTFGCSIWHLVAPFDIWLFRFACVASLFVFNVNHLTNTYAISSWMARPNRYSLYHFDES